MSVTKVDLTSLPEVLLGDIDLFICSASFESRCRSIPAHIDRRQVQYALVAENENHYRLHAGNGEILLGMFEGRCERVLLDTTNPLISADNLNCAIRKSMQKPCPRIVVDVTTFTHEGVLILFRLLRDIFGRVRITYLYAGASEYSVGDKVENKWLSKGIGEIRSVLGYSGRFLPSQRLHLIVMVGFEHERVSELIRQYEPSFVSLGYGESSEPGAERHHLPNRYGFEQVRAVYSFADEFTFCCYDPVKTKVVMREQARRHPEVNVVIATFNTKISTIGAAMAALEEDRIQLCYAQALVYNSRAYSAPSERVYMFEV